MTAALDDLTLTRPPGTAPDRSRRAKLRIGLLLALIAAAWTVPIINEPDAGWMVTTGQVVLDGGFPRTELWSWTAEGSPYVAHAWGAATLMAVAVAAAGLTVGLALYSWLAMTAAFSVLTVRSLHAGYRPIPIGIGLTLLVLGGSFIWSPRGMLMSVAFVLAEALWWDRARRGKVRIAPWWELVALQALWVNLHGMSVLGLLMPAGLAALTFVANWLGLLGGAEQPVPVRELARRLLWRLPGQFATPYGLAGAVHAVTVISRSNGQIQEYSSPNFHWPSVMIGAIVMGLAILWCARGGQGRQALLLSGMLLASCYSQRYFLIALLFAAPTLIDAAQTVLHGPRAGDVDDSTPAARAERWQARAVGTAGGAAALRQLRDAGSRPWLPAMLAIMVGSAGLLLLITNASVKPTESGYAVGPARWLTDNPAADGTRELVAPLGVSGYLVFRAVEQQRADGGPLPWRVSWDGRNDNYPPAVFDANINVTLARPGWRTLLDPRTAITAIAANGSPMAGLLAGDPAWNVAFSDDDFTIYEPVAPASRPLPDLRAHKTGAS